MVTKVASMDNGLPKIIAEGILETESTADLRENMTHLSKECSSGNCPEDKAVLNLLAVLLLNMQFGLVKKHVVLALHGMSKEKVVAVLEDHLIEWLGTENFEESI